MASPVIREAKQNEWNEAMDLAWTTFLKYEADEYTAEGVDNFWNFITDETLRRLFRLGKYKVFVAEADGKIIGVITLRNRTHISLLFVDEKFHRQGVGTALFRRVSEYVFHKSDETHITVNASPYGVPFYTAVGFKAVSIELRQHGIRYTPMKYAPDERIWQNGKVL